LDVQAIRTYLDVAKAYYQKEQKPEEKNLKFEAMNGVFRKERKLFVHVDEAKGIVEAIDLLQGYGFEVVVVGGTEAWQVADFLKERNVPVILGNTHSLPVHADSDYDQPYKTPALLYEKGVKFSFSVEGSWQQRNLPFQAGHAVGFGLPKEAAVSAITKNTADILGIGDRLGSLEVGKEATFIVSLGDALDMQSSQITAAYIGGKAQDLEDKQKDLNRKFRAKLGLK
jgi:imidazolonepropionase-like amidohydrolase